MKPFCRKLLLLRAAVGFLLLLPLASASAFDAFDAYGTPDWAAPDPGNYWQGSSRAPAQRSGASTSPGYKAPQYSSPDYSSPDYSPYGEWDARRLEPDHYDSETDSDWYSSDWSGEQIGPDWRRPDWRSDEQLPRPGATPVPGWRSDSRQQSSGEPSDWRARSPPPSYRFRDDPRLDSGEVVSGNAGYRFRPLTEKELERQRESATASGFRPPRKDRRQSAEPVPGRESYGYEPDGVPGGFFQRYYRADH